jgi:hypothetical protein
MTSWTIVVAVVTIVVAFLTIVVVFLQSRAR